MLSKDETSLRLLLFHVEWMFAWHRDAKVKQQKNVFKMKCFDTFIKCWMLLPSSDALTSGWQRKARIIFLLQKQGHRLTAYHSFAGSGIEMTLGQKSKYQRKVHGEKSLLFTALRTTHGLLWNVKSLYDISASIFKTSLKQKLGFFKYNSYFLTHFTCCQTPSSIAPHPYLFEKHH